jgi:hypothetical protein
MSEPVPDPVSSLGRGRVHWCRVEYTMTELLTRLRADFRDTIDECTMNAFMDSINKIEKPFYILEMTKIIDQHYQPKSKIGKLMENPDLSAWVGHFLKHLPEQYQRYPQIEIILETIPEMVDSFNYFVEEGQVDDAERCRAAMVSLSNWALIMSIHPNTGKYDVAYRELSALLITRADELIRPEA